MDPRTIRQSVVHYERAWYKLLGETLAAAVSDKMSLSAAGCAFYATLALFPAISMLISIGGLVMDKHTAETQLFALSGILPAPAYALIADRVHQLVSQGSGSLSLHLAIGLFLTFWSSGTGAKSILAAINVAYDVKEQRPFLQFQAIGFSMTLVAFACAILAIAVLLVLPQLIDFIGWSAYGGTLIHAASLAMLIVFFWASVSLLYRYGPCREPPPRPHTGPGTALATVLWLAASELLSIYVSRIGTFGATYGSLGAAIGVMLWFYISAYAVLLGAEMNARLEHRDSLRHR